MRSLLLKILPAAVIPLIFTIPLPQKTEVQKEDRVLFAVWAPQKGKQPQAFLLDPIARINGASIVSPLPEGNETEAAYNNFEKNYFASGRSYPLLFGGNELGSITVEKAESISCESLTATATVSNPTPLGLDGLAVSTLQGIHTHDNWRHVASDGQKAGFVKLAGDYLKAHGAEDFDAAKLKIPSLRATRLRQGGPDVLIGSVSLVGKTKIHDLFLMVQLEPEPARILLASHHHSEDLEDRKDLQSEKFVDQLDVDSDGTDEIVTISGYYESWDYAIYREQNGEWKLVYKGGGGGC